MPRLSGMLNEPCAGCALISLMLVSFVEGA
jgi:hypothetical protein